MPKIIKNILIVFLIIVLVISANKAFGIQEFIMKKMYPRTYSEFVIKYAEEYGVDPWLVFAVIKA